MVKLAVAVDDDWKRVRGHAGQATHWLIFDCEPGQAIAPGARVLLQKAQLPHHFRDDGPHPLHGVAWLIAASAGEGFVRHMAGWGAQVLRTGETDPDTAVARVLAGEALPDPDFDITTALCKLRDLFSRH